MQWLTLAEVKPGLALLALTLLALGLCQSVPYLLNRVFVYEVAIAGGYFSLSAALFFLTVGLRASRSAGWLAASGFFFGLAVSCRPHLGIAAAIAIAGLILLTRSHAVTPRRLAVFVFPLAVVGVAIAVYNYARFGDPFEFGIRYLLSGPNQNRVNLARENIVPGLYYWLACRPDFSLVFPWVRMAFRYPFDSAGYLFPPGYFIEATVGAGYLAPCAIGALFVPSAQAGSLRTSATVIRFLLWTAVASAALILLFLAATGFTTQRYEVDFLPLLVLAAVFNAGYYVNRSRGWKRPVLSALIAVSVSFGILVNLALAITGPYDDVLRNRPVNYLRVARWFSPVEHFRPMMNPAVDVSFIASIEPRPDDYREPLLTMGRQAHRYLLYVENAGGKLRLCSKSEGSTMAHDLGPGAGRDVTFRVRYGPESRQISVAVNSHPLFVHEIGTLVTAPSDVSIGENHIDSGATSPRFTAGIKELGKTIQVSNTLTK
jgi:hypothetical protein